jgi:hypothetical protein
MLLLRFLKLKEIVNHYAIRYKNVKLAVSDFLIRKYRYFLMRIRCMGTDSYLNCPANGFL